MITPEEFANFREQLVKMYHLRSALAVLQWDEEVNMPPKGATFRAQTTAHLAGLLHQHFLALNTNNQLEKLKAAYDANTLREQDSVVVREIWREYEREAKLPEKFVIALAQTVSEAHTHWVEARKTNDFLIFLPSLSKIIELKRQEAELIGYGANPYDALIDAYEPGTKTEDLEIMFAELKDFLVPFLKKIKQKSAKPIISLTGSFPLEKQREFNRLVAQKLGYDFEAGRIDVSAHPFSTTFNPLDSRITTRYSEKDLFYSLSSTIHEVGHALYEQGLPPEHFGTPLADSISLGIHESQSRMWENQIGKSKLFWNYWYPKLQKTFPEPFANITLDDFYVALNTVKPSLIRTESDEVTYNLHIVIRFELEKALIDGSLNPKDLPEAWNQKYKDYLGVRVPNNREGVLQDIHWSHGSFGYFPTYTLGNLYAAQFFAAAQKELLYLNSEITRGNYSHLLEWLRKNIHAHGRMFSANDLVQKVTGEPPSSRYFIDYLTNKFSQIYFLSTIIAR